MTAGGKKQRLAARNAMIVAAYAAGETRAAIGSRHGITPRMVSRIVSAAGQAMSLDRMAELNRERLRRGNRGGRPREIILLPEDMRLYVKMRALFGAGYARVQLGIGL